MFYISKKLIIITMVLALSVGLVPRAAFAYHVDVDAIDDAGTAAGQDAFAWFTTTNKGDWYVSTSQYYAGTQWTSSTDVYNYTGFFGLEGWWLYSHGNIWSTTDTVVGETLTGLAAGTYRITAAQSSYLAFIRDGYDWTTPDLYQKWYWELMITATDVYVNGVLMDTYTFTLGSSTMYDTAEAAFAAVLGEYLDITLADGGTLTFWIYDETTFDNGGGVSVDITLVPVPEPSTLLLLLLGVPFIIRKVRSRAH